MQNDRSSDEDILTALGRVGPERIMLGLQSLAAEIPADDWNRNFLAATFGPLGGLRAAIQSHSKYFPDMGLSIWDTELLDVVADVTGLGDDVFLLQWLNMKEPVRLAELCAAHLTSVTGRSIVWRLPAQPAVENGEPAAVRARAVLFLCNGMEEPTRAALLESMRKSGLREWAVENHFPFGVSVRNQLRAAGFTESALGVESLDSVWAELLSDAVHRDIAMEPFRTTNNLATLSPDGAYAEVLRTALELGLNAEPFLESLAASPESERHARQNGWLCLHVWALANAMANPFAEHAEHADALLWGVVSKVVVDQPWYDATLSEKIQQQINRWMPTAFTRYDERSTPAPTVEWEMAIGIGCGKDVWYMTESNEFTLFFSEYLLAFINRHREVAAGVAARLR
jgi:hypothetical protein